MKYRYENKNYYGKTHSLAEFAFSFNPIVLHPGLLKERDFRGAGIIVVLNKSLRRRRKSRSGVNVGWGMAALKSAFTRSKETYTFDVQVQPIFGLLDSPPLPHLCTLGSNICIQCTIYAPSLTLSPFEGPPPKPTADVICECSQSLS